MQKLENLLNILIQRGWKPGGFWGKSKICITKDNSIEFYMETSFFSVKTKTSLRQLVGLESGLWQFVAENCLFSRNINQRDYLVDSTDSKYGALENNGCYRLMKSALIPEEGLVKFLIDNIIIDG